jgi:hypothetical protein
MGLTGTNCWEAGEHHSTGTAAASASLSAAAAGAVSLLLLLLLLVLLLLLLCQCCKMLEARVVSVTTWPPCAAASAYLQGSIRKVHSGDAYCCLKHSPAM